MLRRFYIHTKAHEYTLLDGGQTALRRRPDGSPTRRGSDGGPKGLGARRRSKGGPPKVARRRSDAFSTIGNALHGQHMYQRFRWCRVSHRSASAIYRPLRRLYKASGTSAIGIFSNFKKIEIFIAQNKIQGCQTGAMAQKIAPMIIY